MNELKAGRIQQATRRTCEDVASRGLVLGHHIFASNGRTLFVRDSDVFVLKALLAASARRLEREAVAGAIERWSYLGPGVWADVDEEAIAAVPGLFQEADVILSELGDTIPLEYLSSAVPLAGITFQAPQPTDKYRELLGRLGACVDAEEDR